MKLEKIFPQVWVVDFEFTAPPGERPQPICMVAREFFTNRTHRLLSIDIEGRSAAPFSTGSDALMVAYFASAEIGCFFAAGWEPPEHILDLYVEFRRQTNGIPLRAGSGLLGALISHGIPCIESAEKEAMRELAMRGGPYSVAEQDQLLEYCESDVESTAKLLASMLPRIDVPRAILRGRYMRAVGRIEWSGTPLDTETLKRLRSNWAPMQEKLIERVDENYGVYEGRSFRRDRFRAYLSRNRIPWPQLPSGTLALDAETFRRMSKQHIELAPLRELRHTLGELRLEKLSIGIDGRNRCLLSPFQSRTSRNQPSNSRFVFGPSCWLRGLIKPPSGRALAYIDYSQQEFAIAGRLSQDRAMQVAYQSSDPYLTFAMQADAVPRSATKATHPREREQFKVCALAVQYGMQSQSLAAQLGVSQPYAQRLLGLHQKTYPEYWKWSQAAVDHALLHGWLETVFGWRIHVNHNANPRSLANFPMQANGAEILRLACCLATERGIQVCAPVHDALLIEADSNGIEEAVRETQAAMLEAGRIVLDGFDLRTEALIVRSGERYMDPRGRTMWETVMSLLHELEPEGNLPGKAKTQAPEPQFV